MIVAVVPARGGSKRIPMKNLRMFCGQPIIAYSIAAARESGLFDRIIVSTDHDDIASAAVDCGAEAPFSRPPDIADDMTGTNAVVKHAIEWLQDSGQSVRYACCIYATAPFLSGDLLRAGFDRLRSGSRAFAFSVTSYGFPVQRALKVAGDGSLAAVQPEFMSARSQDLEEYVHDAGQFYWGTAAAFVDSVDMYSGAALPVRVPRHLVQDIDTEEDWRRAELMYRAWQLERGGA